MRYKLAMVALATVVLMVIPSLAYAQFPPTMNDRGYVEGYSHWPMSFPHNSTYVDAYKMGVRDYNWTFQDKAWTFLGRLPAHSTDNYRDFYLGEQAGSDAYCNPIMHKCSALEGGGNGCLTYKEKCSPGHSAEYCAGYYFGFNTGTNFDAS